MVSTLSKSALFMDLYRQLEEIAKERFHTSEGGTAIFNLASHPNFRHLKSEIDYCREVRNLLSHRPLVDAAFPVEPSDEMIALLRKIISVIENPPKALSVATLLTSLLTAGLDDLVLPVMRKMSLKNYTHVPILKNGTVLGVFSESTIFDYLANHENIDITSKVRFRDYLDYLDLNHHPNVSFAFVSKVILTGEAEELFKKRFNNKRLELLFITETGKSTEKLIAMLSPWDLMGQD
jgi:CBS domain-containing protein